MKKIKTYALWILGALVAVLAVILGVSYERKKIAKLKAKAKVAKVVAEVTGLQGKTAEALGRNEGLAMVDEVLADADRRREERIGEVRDASKDRTAAEVATRANRLHGRRGKPGSGSGG